MSITSKRYAVLGWGVWQVGKRTAKYKAKQALKSEEGGGSSMRPGKKTGAIVSAAAAAGGALWFWRRRNGSEAESSD